MARKNLKVSEIVHEEIGIQKQHDESVDDFLRRELGIIPNSLDDLTTYYPHQMEEAALHFVDLFRDEERYFESVIDHDDYFAFNFDAKESRRTIIQLRFKNDPPEINIRYRNERGEMERVGEVVLYEGDEFLSVDLQFTRPDTGMPITVEADFGEVGQQEDDALQALQNAAYERWG